jgi:hypothetical protein
MHYKNWGNGHIVYNKWSIANTLKIHFGQIWVICFGEGISILFFYAILCFLCNKNRVVFYL